MEPAPPLGSDSALPGDPEFDPQKPSFILYKDQADDNCLIRQECAFCNKQYLPSQIIELKCCKSLMCSTCLKEIMQYVVANNFLITTDITCGKCEKPISMLPIDLRRVNKALADKIKYLNDTAINIIVINDLEKAIPLRVAKLTTLNQLKLRIEGLEGISSEHQNLYFQGTLLTSENTALRDFAVKSGDTIHLKTKVEPPKTPLRIKYLLDEEPKLTVFVPTYAKVKAIKEQIQSKSGLPAERQRLVYKGKILDNEKFIKMYNLQSHEILVLSMEKAKERLIYFVESNGKRSAALHVTGDTTIKQLKEMAEKQLLKIDMEEHRLFYEGAELEDERREVIGDFDGPAIANTIDTYLIKDKSDIMVIMKI